MSSGSFAGASLAGWRLLRCNPWSHGGVDYAHDQTLFPARLAEGAHVILGGILSPLENVLTEVLTWLHDTGRAHLGVVDRRARP